MNADSYIHGNSFYHRFDVRPKLLFTLLYIIIAFMISSWYGLLLAAALPVLVLMHAAGAREALFSIRRLLPVVILLYLFMPLQSRDGIPLLSIGSAVIVTEEGFLTAFRISMRFIALSSVLMLLIATTRSGTIIAGLRFYRLPYNASLLLSILLRFIPYLGALFSQIRDSMSLRLQEGKRGFPIMPSVTAFIVAAVRMIPDTASALEERGFGRPGASDAMRLGNAPHLFTQFVFGAILPLIFMIAVR